MGIVNGNRLEKETIGGSMTYEQRHGHARIGIVSSCYNIARQARRKVALLQVKRRIYVYNTMYLSTGQDRYKEMVINAQKEKAVIEERLRR